MLAKFIGRLAYSVMLVVGFLNAMSAWWTAKSPWAYYSAGYMDGDDRTCTHLEGS